VSATRGSLEPDPAVPQRDQLTDAPEIARRLRTRLDPRTDLSIRSCHLGAISYRPGKRLRVVYRLELDGSVLHVAASTFRSTKRGERAFRKAQNAAHDTGPFRPVLYDGELETVFWTFPNDRSLENLPALVDPASDLAAHLDRRWLVSDLVDYYPEASAVVRCLDDSRRTIAYGKVYAGSEGENTLRIQEALARAADGPRLRIARPLAYSTRRKSLLIEPIEGPSIARLPGTQLLSGLHAYGAALATLHSIPLALVVSNGSSSLARLQRRAAGVQTVRPDVSGSIHDLLAGLTTRWEEAAGEPVPIHGDTNVNNAIVQGNGVTLIDFDRATVGSRGSDIGNLLGLFRYFRALGLISPSEERERASAFRRGYASVRSLPDEQALRVHEAAAVAERAFRAVTRLRSSALPLVPALLAEAGGLLR
jgi:aminoglycoside phosphotransferase